ncbi:hypothetical protein FOL47_006063 [Perkinsus chesapeaki]|uniref:Uncharacterized protein n=1 Tax=Perkinsus chesapeaki TaxID=330153 RepID=A0A7J6LUW1_PERCH|nr:hypothetical protein FOL47_006063 [Perkinsus chesapeaki]
MKAISIYILWLDLIMVVVLSRLGAPSPPTGKYFYRPSATICVETEWLYGTPKEDLILRVDRSKPTIITSPRMTLKYFEPDTYEVSPVSDQKHSNYVVVVNTVCDGILEMSSHDLFSFQYENNDLITDLVEESIVLTPGHC